MTFESISLLIIFLIVLMLLAYPLGKLISQVADKNERVTGLHWLHPIERMFYKIAGIKNDQSNDNEMGWKSYTVALLVFNTLGALVVYGVQRVQFWLPLNPQNFANVSPDSSLNTAVSFVTNTNWQGYVGEATMSYLTQMLALTGQNFFSAATGIAVVFALIRGFSRHSSKTIGNFWVDMTRSVLYLLLPLSIIFTTLFMSQGVIQNFSTYKEVQLIEPVTYSQAAVGKDGLAIKNQKGEPVMESLTTKTQTIAMGPVASQEAIKLLGTNGGGFFNMNSAHPYENPTAFSNFLQMIAIFLIPAGLCFAFGRLVGDQRQGFSVISAMTILFVVMALGIMSAEVQPHPVLSSMNVDQSHSQLQSGGYMEGKETRFGMSGSSLFIAVTTAASCGAVNTMHDSLMPLSGLIPMALMQFGEVVFGGVGSGLYGMLVFALLAVFIAGLMIGRTPEYLGKKIMPYEMKMVSIAILITPILVLVGTAISVTTDAGRLGILNPGAHGFSEVLYAFTSAANNNGSAFAGLSSNTVFYNTMLAIAMWFGRFAVIVAVLAIAGSLSAKKRLEVHAGTMPTHGFIFIALLAGTVVLISVLNYVPALALGPIAEHLYLINLR